MTASNRSGRVYWLLAGLAISLLMLSLGAAAFSVVNYVPASNPTVQEGQSQLFNFTLGYGSNESVQALWYLNNSPLATGLTYTFPAAYASRGSYNVTAFISNNSQIYQHTWILTVIRGNSAPLIQPLGPFSVSENEELLFTLTAIDPDNDPVMISVSSLPAGAFFDPARKVLTFRPAVGQAGSYSMTFYASDGQAISSMNVQIIVNPAAYNLTILSPAGVITSKYVQLAIASDRNASCRFSTTSVLYPDMISFDTTNGTYHTGSLTMTEGYTSLAIRCIDNSGYERSKSFQLETRLAPEAIITLEPETPLPEGVVVVTLQTSKPLRAAPSFSYAYDDTPADRRTISLEQLSDPTAWKGHFIILGNVGTKSASFSFQGEDLTGIGGTLIRQGKTFIVDTDKPAAVDGIKAHADSNGTIRLVWHYLGEETKGFRIHRSTSGGVDYIDYYTSSNSQSFSDLNAESGRRFYYRVSAVDLAGNEGLLSSEVSAMISGSQETAASDEPAELSPAVSSKANSTVRQMERLAIDVQFALNSLDSVQKPYIQALRVRETAELAKADLEDLISQLKAAIRSNDEGQVSRLLAIADLKVKKTQSTVVKSVSNVDSSQFSQTFDADSLSRAIDAAAKSRNLSRQDMQQFEKEALSIQSQVRVYLTAVTADLLYLDEHATSKTVVTKDVTYDSVEALKSPMIVELIPKGASQSAADIEVSPSSFEVLERDPVLAFMPVELSLDKQEYNFTFSHRVGADILQSMRTVVLPQISIHPPANAITANFLSALPGKGSAQSLGLIAGIFAVILLAGYYGWLKTASPRRVAESRLTHPHQRQLASQEFFYAANGAVARDLPGMLAALQAMDEHTFSMHVNSQKNDICNWLVGSYGLVALSSTLRNARTRDDYCLVLRHFLRPR